MERYKRSEVLDAARRAYFGAVGPGHDDYVRKKSNLFVARCLQMGLDSDADYISMDAIEEMCFEMLDADVERDLINCLTGKVW